MNEIVKLLFDAQYVINIFFVIVIIFYERKNPASTWAWMMVILIVPYFGFLLYLILGADSRKHTVFIQKLHRDETILREYLLKGFDDYTLVNEELETLRRRNIVNIKGAEHLNDLVYLNLHSGGGAFTTGNAVEPYFDGASKFEALLEDIEKAKNFIHMQYYIVRTSRLGRRIFDALTRKSREGVEVCFFTDGMGSPFISREYKKTLVDAGGRLAVFYPPRFIRLNYRNHRKLAIIDGTVGYVGGFNIGDEYLGESKRFGYWRDAHLRITGPAVRQLELRFIMDWNFCHRERIKITDKYFPSLTDRAPAAEPGHPADRRGQGVNMQVISSGPDTRWPNIYYAYSKMISEANRSIYIQSPYFVPDDGLFEALRIAALSGIDVRIVIPARPDHPFVYWAALSYLGDLVSAGVKCYQYTKGFLHSKLMIIDGVLASVGTANMDVRSFKLNFEVSAIIYDSETVSKLTGRFESDLCDCDVMDVEWYESRSGMSKIKEALSRLLSPLL
ncbi:MAG: cardiolipin synthase [Clostridiales bacterium]|jgi:cardiolipin synthase|nr:cardiolipin synthase [Clostridiales bacterium]